MPRKLYFCSHQHNPVRSGRRFVVAVSGIERARFWVTTSCGTRGTDRERGTCSSTLVCICVVDEVCSYIARENE
jgi:hypothetical protein